MLYLAKRNNLENGLNYYIEIDKSKLVARYSHGEKNLSL